ncbi:MAG: tail fiber protein [Azospirillaceae bacterium]|nr:tail fiber protein [Azospirillaceae bacterium]
MDSFVGEIRILPYQFPPSDWAYCNGATMQVSQQLALYSLIGTIYGTGSSGGTPPNSTFMLPDLRGQVVVGSSNGALPGWNGSTRLASNGGTDAVTLSLGQMPGHSHAVALGKPAEAVNQPSTASYLANSLHWTGQNAGTAEAYAANSNTALPFMLAATGGGRGGATVPHDNRQPYLTLNYCICLSGIYPEFSY